MTKDYRTQEAEIKAACLSIFGEEGGGGEDCNEWKWEVSPIPGLYLIIWIEKDEKGNWTVEEPNTDSKDFGPDLEVLLVSVVSQLRDVWIANPHPAIHLFFGDLNIRQVK